MRVIKKIGKVVFLFLAPATMALAAAALLCSDLLCRLKALFRTAPPEQPSETSRAEGDKNALPACTPYQPPRNASIVIPNWNGRELLEKNLPSVLEASTADDEVIVVDNASSDGSADYLRRHFPQVRVLQMERNLGFGGGCNAGVQAALNRIVILLNNDMRATPGFLSALLEGFTDEAVFAVSAQIFFSDPSRRREETGLTVGKFEKGFLRVSHEIDERITVPFPIFYAGGGSTAYDRDKFLEMGGFDPLFEPFYLEDTDLSYGAWRRGWKILYQPESHLYHEHRATIAKHYSPEAIRAYLKKNYVLMVWKNIHQWRWLMAHFWYLYGQMILCWLGRETETRTPMGAFLRALRKLPAALRSRSRALSRARVNDPAVFQRTRPAVFRDVFTLSPETPPSRETQDSSRGLENLPAAPSGEASDPAQESPPLPDRPLNILFVSPYSIFPPLHGGAVFMLQAIEQMAKRHNLYVLTFVDCAEEVESNRSLEGLVRHVEATVRRHPPRRRFSLRSQAEMAFEDPQFGKMLEKMVFLNDIDLIQFEYTQMAQYHLPLQHTSQCLFEHNVYFQSVQREILAGKGGPLVKAREFLEWLRAMRFEVAAAGKFDAVFTCHDGDRQLLESFLNGGRPRVLSGLRTGIDVSNYPFPGGPRRPDSLLFVGNFQHAPNVEGLEYFCRKVLPLIRARLPQATLSVVGAQALPEVQRMFMGEGIRLLGRVPDVREPLSQHAVFVCPILVGAGVRVKILEAFASGIPVVSTSIGAEGLGGTHGADIMLTDSPDEFAAATLHLLEHPKAAAAMAAEARRLVETRFDWPVVARKLDQVYRELVASRSDQASSGGDSHR